MACAAAVSPVEYRRNPDGNVQRKSKASGHHSHDRINASVHSQVELRQFRGAAEVALPVTVADDHRPRAMLTLLFRNKIAAEKRFDAERLEEAAGNR